MSAKKIPGWLYHAEHEPRIFYDQAEYDAALAAGWVDSPAKVEAVPTPPPAPEPIAVPESIAGMDKDALCSFAKDSLGLSLDKRFGLENLQQQVAAIMAGAA